MLGLSKTCEQYIIDAMDWKADIIGLKRVETPEIPVEAVREAIINSYGHRLYDNNQCNEIDVFKNRIEIHTTGGFPKGHTPEEFLNGNKKAIRRNKLITGVLYYSDDMETFATGLKRIKDLCDEAGCKVEFRMEQDDFVVVFYRNLREEWNSVEKAQNLNGTNQDTNQDTVQVGIQDKTSREEKILGFCEEPRTRAEIQEFIGISNRGYFRTEILEPLLSGGKLLMTIPDKPNSRNQKYVTAVKI